MTSPASEQPKSSRQPTVTPLLWQVMTPLHVGTGQVSASVIDLPIAREGATRYPVIPASSIKGVVRDGEELREAEQKALREGGELKWAHKLFGYTERKVKRENASNAEDKVVESGIGDLSFTDARLFALPVPSYAGTFALVTCPLVIERLNRDRQTLGLKSLTVPKLNVQSGSTRDIGQEMVAQQTGITVVASSQPATTDRMPATVPVKSLLIHEVKEGQNTKKLVILQDLDFEARESEDILKLIQELTSGIPGISAATLAQRLCLVEDDVFAFLCETATEVTAHVKLEPDRKTVVNGHLWYEEALPAEAILTSFVFLSNRHELVDPLQVIRERPYLQLGGKSSVGRGLTRVFLPENKQEKTGGSQ